MDNTKKAMIVTKALAYTENGGKPTSAKKGKSGEMKSIFQFTPDTWKGYSKQTYGEVKPLNNETESEVVFHKVKNWLDAGKSVEQIASMWNAGESRPNAYAENHKGTNKYGVAYDTPAYAKKVASYATSFEKGDNNVPDINSTMNPSGIPAIKTNNQTAKNTMTPKNSGVLANLAVNNLFNG